MKEIYTFGMLENHKNQTAKINIFRIYAMFINPNKCSRAATLNGLSDFTVNFLARKNPKNLVGICPFFFVFAIIS